MSTPWTRRTRRWIGAPLAILLVFASVMAAAHACTVAEAAAPAFADGGVGGPAMPGCDGTPAEAGAAAACAFHCTAGNLPDLQPVFPPPPAIAQPPLRVEVADDASSAVAPRPQELLVLAAAPPPLLRFARLLI